MKKTSDIELRNVCGGEDGKEIKLITIEDIGESLLVKGELFNSLLVFRKIFGFPVLTLAKTGRKDDEPNNGFAFGLKYSPIKALFGIIGRVFEGGIHFL